MLLFMYIHAAAEEMDQADEELRNGLKKLWPLHAKKNLIDIAVPPNSGSLN